MKPLQHLAVVAPFLSLFVAPPLTAAPLQTDMAPVVALYKHLHANPELSFQERETSARLARELEALGYAVTKGVGGYGLFGVMENGEGPTVMVRADMDGLPVKEQTGFKFASQATADISKGNTVPVMHACGHDIHMSSWFGTAKAMAENKGKWSGTLVFLAQPAEERGAGARAMLRDGLYKKMPLPDYNLALHVKSDMPAGTVGTVSGYAMANVDSVDIYVKGIGGHGAYPHTTKDPIVLAARIVGALQTLVSREISPLEAGVVTVGAFNAGSKHNVISDEAHLQLTVRSYSDETRDQLLDGIKRIARGEAIAAGMPEEKMPIVKIKDERTPSLYNDPALTQRLQAAFAKALGEKNARISSPVMGGEDFAEYGRTKEDIPGMLFWLGAIDPDRVTQAEKSGETLPSLHSPFFAPDYEPTLETGVKAMTAAVMDLMGRAPEPTSQTPGLQKQN